MYFPVAIISHRGASSFCQSGSGIRVRNSLHLRDQPGSTVPTPKGNGVLRNSTALRFHLCFCCRSVVGSCVAVSATNQAISPRSESVKSHGPENRPFSLGSLSSFQGVVGSSPRSPGQVARALCFRAVAFVKPLGEMRTRDFSSEKNGEFQGGKNEAFRAAQRAAWLPLAGQWAACWRRV